METYPTGVVAPTWVGPSITRNSGIIGEGVDLNLEHLGDIRPATLLFHLTHRLLYAKFRDPGEEPNSTSSASSSALRRNGSTVTLFVRGGTCPAQLMHRELAGMACNRITAGITRAFLGERPIKALLDPYNPTGSTRHVRFTTSKTARWETSSERCHINWVILDSDWEAEFCRVAESHLKVRAYVKTKISGSTSLTATARRSAPIGPTSSCWWMTAAARTTFCTSSSRSRATGARTRRRRRPRRKRTGYQA